MTSDLARTFAGVMGDEEFARVMGHFAGAFARYRRLLPAIPRAYSRTRLAAAPAYEIVAMNWAPRSISPIHDHGTSRCWAFMLDGLLEVQNYTCHARDLECDCAVLQLAEHLELRAGDIDHRLVPTELHRVRNPSRAHPAFSLQLYAPPLSTYSIVDLHTSRRRVATATFDLDMTRQQDAAGMR
jgi:hypothetical protein